MIKYIHDAMAAKREQLENNDKGFTLIELLVVVLILGILAAIAIPVFIGQQNSANDGAAKANLANAKVATVSFLTAGGTWPASDVATGLRDYGWPQSAPAVSASGTPTLTAYCLTVASDSGTDFEVRHNTEIQEGDCS